ncbi:aminopeptidase [Halomonas denitrificans]|nr:aminopeptidase [Halomonas denitrificans]
MYQSVKILLLLGAASVLGGCATLQWYGQAARGQMELLTKRQDIEQLLADEALAADTRRKLETVLDVREFASRELGLPDNDSYRSLVELDRPYVLWNVVAAPEFSVEPKTWCYPLVGCLAYRGWFRKSTAERSARRLAERGMDVRVAPVAAYSTLGRFADPVTSPMLARDPVALAGLVLHELAHQQLFVAGDTRFSEAFATAVERAGLDRWLLARGHHVARRRLADERRTTSEFLDLLLEARRDLAALYAGPLDEEAMRAAKRRRLGALRDAGRRLAERRGTDRFDPWLSSELNNADLALVATYEDGTRAFAALLAEYDGDFGRFLHAAQRLSEQPAESREAFLNSCRTTACP